MRCAEAIRGTRILALAILGALACGFPGCSRSEPRREPPAIDPARAAQAALTQYDQNQDGALDSGELHRSPPLLAARETIDRDGDGRLTAPEIEARIQAWRDSRAALVSVECKVVQGSVPLPGATVEFLPEEFLGPQVRPARGTTDEQGMAALSIEGEAIAGHVHCGLYRVSISRRSGEREMIAAKFNRETRLGEEIAPDSSRRKAGIVYDVGK
jgi:hypothetical protein